MKIIKFLSIFLFLFISFSLYTQTTIILQPNAGDGKDASVTLNAGNNNYGTYQSIVAYTWTNSGNLGKMRGLLEFDLSVLPDNAILTDASLSLYYNPTDDIQSFDLHTGSNAAYIQRITESWNESTVTWNNQPSSTSVNQVELDASASGTQNYLNIDVTTLINDMLTAPEGNNGMMLKMQNETNPYRSLLFASSDNTNSALRPKLTLSYVLNTSDSCSTLKPGAEGKDASVTLNAATNNYGDYESMVIFTWTNSGALGNMRSLLEFDLSFIPENAIISSASLSLFYNPTDNLQSFDIHTGNNDAYIQRITETWEEGTVNWSNQPESTTLNQVELAASTSGTQNYTNIDVSDLVTDLLDPNNDNYGFIIKMQNEENPYRSLLFASSDNSNTDLHPELEVCWNVTTSINEIESTYDINIFPNPNNGIFSIEISEEINEFNYVVFNVSGQVILSENCYANKAAVDLSDFTKGLYFIKLIFGNKETAVKRILLK